MQIRWSQISDLRTFALPLAFVGSVLGAALAVLLLAPFVWEKDNESVPPAVQAPIRPQNLGGPPQGGGGGNPSAAMLERLNSLPAHPQGKPFTEPIGAENYIATSYTVDDAPQAVMAYLAQAYIAEGWRPVGGPQTVTSEPKSDKDRTRRTATVRRFTKDGMELVVSVTSNDKDPSLGATEYRIALTVTQP